MASEEDKKDGMQDDEGGEERGSFGWHVHKVLSQMPKITRELFIPESAVAFVPRVTTGDLFEDYTDVLAFGEVDKEGRYDPLTNRAAEKGKNPHTKADVAKALGYGNKQSRKLKKQFFMDVLYKDLQTELYVFWRSKLRACGLGIVLVEVRDVYDFQGSDTVEHCQVYFSFVPFTKLSEKNLPTSLEPLVTYMEKKGYNASPNTLILHWCDFEYGLTIEVQHQKPMNDFDAVFEKAEHLLELCEVDVWAKDLWWDIRLFLFHHQCLTEEDLEREKERGGVH
uniref:Uncharacterized protein n=1 Tax=Paramoeba aestuarina TaxID=180227 RepID=A0A7S4L3P9_9EUKA|mmetsp:Transcript_30977/g.48279  ORF Transcript_30977/g.48279 Transcript_30977/m.48279 type:complete len:281 (+) Transcript_30977:96-938(+)